MPTKTPPPPKRRSTLSAPPKPPKTPRNLNRSPNEGLVALNFRVPAHFRRRFKMSAAANDMSGVALLKAAFELWEQQQNGRY